MKKILFFFAALLILFQSNAFSFGDSTFSLSGKISGYGDGIIAISYSDPNEIIKQDTILIKNDVFTFTGSMNSPRMAFMKIMGNENLKDPYYRIDFILANEKVTITANVKNMREYELKGSEVTAKYKHISKEGQASRMDFMDAYKEWSKLPKGSEEKLAGEKLLNEKRDKYLSFILSQEDFENCDACAYSLYLFTRYVPWKMMHEILPRFNDNIHTNVYYKYLEKVTTGAARIETGNMAADFKVKDLKGKDYSLKDFNSGKYVLLAFSASWCVPCKVEYPFLREAYSTYSSKGLNVLIINVDKEKKDWQKDVEKYNFPFPVLADLKAFDGDITKNYGVFSIPKIFIISPEGKIVSNSVRGKGIIEALDKIYNKAE